MAVNPRRTFEKAKGFFATGIWSATGEEVRRGRALLYRAGRILYATVQGTREQRSNFRAAALTYFSVLSIVPFLAFAFSILKGFGEYQRIMQGTVQPILRNTFGESQALLAAIEQILGFVEKTGVSGLGALGILLLAYTSISLLANIETALNDIWGAKTARPLLRQVTDYTTVLVIGPLLVLVAITFATAAQSSGLVNFLRDRLALGLVIDILLKLTSVVFGCIAMIALFILMPNVKVKLSSAIFGGTIGGILWQALLIAHVRFQMGVASYNALYSGFAAIPIFLVWIYMSWRVVLLAAQLAASHQHERQIHQIQRARHVDQELRETLAVAMTSLVAARFLAAKAPPTQADLSNEVQAPAPTVDEVLDVLVRRGMLVRVVGCGELGYVPGRDIDAVRLSDILAAVRVDPAASELKEDVARSVDKPLVELLAQIERAIRTRAENLTLRQLAELVVEKAAPAPAAEEVAATSTSMLDGKQPEVGA